MAERIRACLADALDPRSLEVLDEGHLHVGHAGEGQGHYRVRITSSAFAGVLPIKRHRMVYAAVGSLMGEGIHALAIEAHAPGESGAGD
jgi:BolA protein